MTNKQIAVYASPLALPLSMVMICRLVVWACGIEWTEDVGGPVAFISIALGMFAGLGMIALAHADGWFK